MTTRSIDENTHALEEPATHIQLVGYGHDTRYKEPFVSQKTVFTGIVFLVFHNRKTTLVIIIVGENQVSIRNELLLYHMQQIAQVNLCRFIVAYY